QWKVGESKSITIETHEVKYENGQVKEDTVRYLDSEIKVLRDTPKEFEISIAYQNIALTSVVEMYSAFEEELKGFEKFDLVYSVNKTTGEYELQNWKETRSFMLTGFEQIKSLVDEKMPELNFMVELTFGPIVEVFDNKENIMEFTGQQF